MLKKSLPLALGATLLAAAFCLPAQADEASVKKAIEAKLGAKVTSVTKSSYLGLYEVYAEGQILYTDEKQTAIIAGTLIDGKTMKNVTAERMQKLTAIKFSDLPIEHAVKQVRGDGKRILASFEDPNCGYCKKLAKDMMKLDNVTIYTFLYPILSPDSTVKSQAVWCAPDKGKAWDEWMLNGKAPKAGTCDAPLKELLALGKKLQVTGTPTIIFGDDTRVGGAIPADRLRQKLDSLGKPS